VQTPLKITFKEMETSPAIESDIRTHAERLERLFDRITSCRVTIAATTRSQRQGKLYRCSVDISVPGNEIVAGHVGPNDHAHEDVHVAVRDAFDAAGRRLSDHARRVRGDTKTHAVWPGET
jgi:ribosomal subunit interface protein